jgi:hypothetical protein
MTDSSGKDEKSKGALAEGAKQAVETFDRMIAAVVHVAATPIVALGSAVEYAAERERGKSHEEAKEAAKDAFYEYSDSAFEWGTKNARKIRKGLGLAHGIDISAHAVHGLEDAIESTPPIPDVPVQPFDPEDV